MAAGSHMVRTVNLELENTKWRLAVIMVRAVNLVGEYKMAAGSHMVRTVI
jgi:hypothetical protein